MKNVFCPQCGSNNYSFRRTQKGIEWSCKDCKFKKLNKTAVQHLNENHLSGRLKSEINRIEEKFNKRKRSEYEI